MASSHVAMVGPLLRKTDGANIIHTLNTIWSSQHGIFAIRRGETIALSEVLTLYPNYIAFSKAGRRIGKMLAFVSAHYIRNSEAFSEHEMRVFGVSKFFVSFSLTSWAYFQNFALFEP